MRLILISDTHGSYPMLPKGDVLIHAGDATMMGTPEEVVDFDAWLGTLDFEHIIFTPGNHDFLFEEKQLALKNAVVLINESIEIDGIKIWASPLSTIFGPWAFMKDEVELAEVWKTIPNDVDLVVTHGPPKGILDLTVGDVSTGSQSLLDRIEEIKPLVHVFGHIHEGYGVEQGEWTQFMNVSLLNEYYQLVNLPTVIDLYKGMA